MSVFSSLFSRLAFTKARGTKFGGFELAAERAFLPGFVGSCAVPDGYKASLDDINCLCFENSDKSMILRLSSLTIHNSENASSAFDAVRDKGNAKEIIALDEMKSRAVVLTEEYKSNETHKFYCSQIAQHDKMVIMSITFDKKIYDIDLKDAKRIFLNYATSVNIFDNVPIQKDYSESDYLVQETFESNEIDWLNAVRKQSIKLAKGHELPYPMTPKVLDDLFGRAIQFPELYAGLDAMKLVLGVSFGDYLVDKYAFKWAYSDDEHGRDLAVIKALDHQDGQIYPIDAVQKRSSLEDAGFLSEIESVVVKKFLDQK